MLAQSNKKMRKDTKLYKVLRYMYLNRDKKVTSKEIMESTGVDQPIPYMNRLSNRINKETINGKNYYQMKKNEINYIGRKLAEAV